MQVFQAAVMLGLDKVIILPVLVAVAVLVQQAATVLQTVAAAMAVMV
jgi:hypothetical protein